MRFPLLAKKEGTTLEVVDLFYNTPVRRRFLKSEKTEFQAIDDLLRRLALSHAKVSFSVRHQGRVLRYYPAVSAHLQEAQRASKIVGDSFMKHALPVCLQAVGLDLKGWVSPPHFNKQAVAHQYFFCERSYGKR